MMAECTSAGKVLNIHNRHRYKFIERMACILKMRMDELNNSLRALWLAEEPSGP